MMKKLTKKDHLRTGDVLFTMGQNWISKSIAAITFSKVSHVGIMYDPDSIFETDIKFGKAGKHPVSSYYGKDVRVFRPMAMTNEQIQRIKDLCNKYDKKPYSGLDILTNALFFFLHPKLRRSLVSAIGTKGFMICSEMTARILYGSDELRYPYFKGYEGFQPADLLEIIEREYHNFREIIP